MTEYSLLSPLAFVWVLAVAWITYTVLAGRVKDDNTAVAIGLVVGVLTLLTPLPGIFWGAVLGVIDPVSGGG